MPISTIASIEDVQTSSAQVLTQATNYTDVAIPQQLQDVLKPLLPAKPSEVSNTTWDFKTHIQDKDGNNVETWNACPTIDYVDQSANISLDIAKTLVSEAKAKTIVDSNAYTDSSIKKINETLTNSIEASCQESISKTQNYTDQQISILTKTIEALKVEKGMTIYDVVELLDALDSNRSTEWGL